MTDINDLLSALRHAISKMPAAELPAVAAELAAVNAIVWARLVASPGPIATVPDDVPVTAEEASQQTGVPASWLRDAARRGRIPCLRFGSHVRFRVRDVLEAVKDNPPLHRRKRTQHRTVKPEWTKTCSNRKAPSDPANAAPPRNRDARKRAVPGASSSGRRARPR